MTKARQIRSLAAVAIQRCSEQELRVLHNTITDLSPVAFIELIRDIEDEIESSVAVALERVSDSPLPSFGSSELYTELERIRRNDLRIQVHVFADLLTKALLQDHSTDPSLLPTFDTRRGLQAWVNRLVRALSEQQIFRAAMQLRAMAKKNEGSVWKLR
jgi:hypothetical protein